ncbi:MAG: hypothetical protein ACM3UV_03430 [Nocardioidaceae bacterium]
MSRFAMLHHAAHRRLAAEGEWRREMDSLRRQLELAELFIPVEARAAYRIAAAQLRDEEEDR